MVSVVIPVYNREVELQRALKSVLNQTVTDIEILVVDDCSEIDLNNLVIKPLNDNRIQYFRLDKKGNGNVCRNLGIQKAKGKYIAMLDSDDEWLPNHLEKRIEWIERTNVDGLYGSHYTDNGIKQSPALSRKKYDGESMADYLLTNGVAQTSTYFFKSVNAKSILWDETLKRHQDYDYAIRFAEQYDFQPCTELTGIVHWVKGERRVESFEAQMRFIEKHKSTISPRVYNQYHYKAFFQAAGRADVDSAVVKHYRKESARYIQHLTLAEYLAVAGYQKPSFNRFLLRLKFVLLLSVKIK